MLTKEGSRTSVLGKFRSVVSSGLFQDDVRRDVNQLMHYIPHPILCTIASPATKSLVRVHVTDVHDVSGGY